MTATLNIRLPKELKQHGQQVLDRENISTSDLIRALYQYMEDYQQVPSFMNPPVDTVDDRRQALRSMAGCISISEDAESLWHAHLDQKYGDA